MTKKLIFQSCVLATFCVASANATTVTYFGDSTIGPATPAEARDSFMADAYLLGGSLGVEDFNALEAGILNFEGYVPILTASIDGGVYSSGNYWIHQNTIEVGINFDSAISAFGLDLGDVGDNNNGVDINLLLGGVVVASYDLENFRNDVGTYGQSNFWGVISDTLLFDSVTMNATNPPVGDWFTLDNIIAGNVPYGAPVPEPATMLLFGAGLAGIAGIRSRKKIK